MPRAQQIMRTDYCHTAAWLTLEDLLSKKAAYFVQELIRGAVLLD
jgi:hypothetical protein